MNYPTYRRLHRLARLSSLGTLAMSTSRALYEWLLTEVYDLRHPHVGGDKHSMRGRVFDSLRGGARERLRLRKLYASI